MNSIEKDFADTLSILTDFNNEAKFIVAFSGGVDSLALLALCSHVLPAERFIPVYVNHRLRSDAELAEEIFLNEENCVKLGTKLVVRDLGKDSVSDIASERKGGIEDAARYLRYGVLEEERASRNFDYILTAHHVEDQIETVLMRLLKHSPSVSLKGITSVSGIVLRPLLDFEKSTLIEYVAGLGLKNSFDSTNADCRFSRNKIRNEILPELTGIMPDCRKRILEIRNKAFSRWISCNIKPSFFCELQMFRSSDRFQREAILFSMWDFVFGYRQMPGTLIDRVCELVDSYANGTQSSNGASFTVYNDYLFLTADFQKDEASSFSEAVKHGTFSLPLGVTLDVGCSKASKTDLRFECVEGLKVRFAQEGDTIALKDGTKKVMRLLQDMKIPGPLRFMVPVFTDETGVAAVFGSVLGGRDRIAGRYRTGNPDCCFCVKFSTLLAH